MTVAASMCRLVAGVAGLGMLALSGCAPAPAPGTVVGVAPVAAYASNNCYAGFYQCVLPAAQQAGTQCACPGLGAPSYGVVR